MEPFILVEPGNILKIFTKPESRELEKKWMKIFCKNKQGLNTKAYKWHIFSGGGYPSVSEDEAQSEYNTHSAEKYVVMSNDDEPAFLTDERPNNLNYRDVYVFPENMAWTMAFTHEQGWLGLGPYFAKHKNYAALERDNKKYLEKRKQIEIAKSKGWM